jgi:hypothetical protein
MKIRSVSVCVLLLFAAVMSVCGLWLASTDIHAQRAQTPLDIAGIDHTVVDGSSVFVIAVGNTGPTTLNASGEFVLVDAQGFEVSAIQVSTGEIGAGQSSVVTVPLNTILPPGRYTATLSLVDEEADVRAISGLREIMVGDVAPGPTPQPAETMPPPEIEDADDLEGSGFPSWLLLLIGITLTVVGVGYMRATSTERKPVVPRPIPEVSMIRKVKVDSRPVKRPATIKPLLPPRQRED